MANLIRMLVMVDELVDVDDAIQLEPNEPDAGSRACMIGELVKATAHRFCMAAARSPCSKSSLDFA